MLRRLVLNSCLMQGVTRLSIDDTNRMHTSLFPYRKTASVGMLKQVNESLSMLAFGKFPCRPHSVSWSSLNTIHVISL